MSREDNQGAPRPQSTGSVGSGTEASEGSHRITINDPSSSTNTRKSYQMPTSPASSAPKIRRRKSTYHEDDDDYYDDDDYDYDSEDSRKRKRRELKRRNSHRRRKSGSVASNVEDDVDENQNDDDDLDVSDHEYTLKDRQEAINTAHPFGLPIWKPALYKKSRTVERNADSALHLIPAPGLYLNTGNILWAIFFGWWLALISFIASIALFLTPFGGFKYAKVLRELSYYIFWPFGKFVEKERSGNEEQPTDYFSYRDSTTSIDDADTDNEDRPLLGRIGSRSEKFDLLGKLDEIGLSGVVFYFWFFLVISPTFLLVSAICWLSVFPIPMAKLTYILLGHLRRDPLLLHFKPGSCRTSTTPVLLCTDKAFGLQYYKYTYDGINIMFINLMPLVFFVIIDDRFLKSRFPDSFFATEEFTFALSLASVIPLSYFIGMSVASISAQSSIGMGAVINATFGSIIEIILYAIALSKGNGKLTEGSIIGSLMAGVLLMPGVSMISGGLKKKEQKFNSKSAGVTSTMLIMAIIGAITPTLFYQTYAPYKMTCVPCDDQQDESFLNVAYSCQVCSHTEVEPTETALYKERVKPLMFFCAVILIFSYLIGLWFTLRTHASLVYSTPHQNELRPQSIYHRLVPMNIITQLLPQTPSFLYPHHPHNLNPSQNPIPAMTLPRPMSAPNSDGQNMLHYGSVDNAIHLANVASSLQNPNLSEHEEEVGGGHDSPNWSKVKSGVVLVSCTLLYSFIAEILVDNVSFVLQHVSVTEKILGLTLFALVPNVTEFLNAMLFSLYGNIALSMEIGSAYALQVCLLQIPAMVAYSAWLNKGKTDEEQRDHTFTLVFPRWDVFSVIFSVFLLTYTYIEGKSNYFKGSILILSYLVLMAGFFYAPDSHYDSYNL